MRRSRLFLLAVVVAVVGVPAAPAIAAPSDVPTPTVTGPIPATATSYPFLKTDKDLSQYGYVEEEYLVTGNASTYLTGGLATGSKVTTGGPNGDGTYPYRTRIVVRRPANPANFNGTTVVEWYNVTAGFDVEWNWFNDPDYLMRKGYAFVGVTAQNAGAQFLRAWNPSRYGTLDVRSTTGTSGNPATDSMSYDIYASVAKAVKGAGSGVDPMGGLATQRVIASGESQSGSRLNIYYNNIQPLHGVFDSFLITVAGGTLRSDRPEKAIRVLSERENLTGPPTSDPDTPNYRRWDVAGSSHLPFMAYQNFAAPAARDIPGSLTADCLKRPLSRVPWPFVYNRALDAIGPWQAGGATPANAPRMLYPSPSGAVLRDGDGNARGGIRLPDIEVPTAENTGANSPTSASGFSAFCTLLGSWTQFSSANLHGRYADYGDYVDRYAAKAQAVADQGFVNQDDVPRMNATAERYTRMRPTAPALQPGSATPNAGPFGLRWRGPAPTETATTYELQRKSSAPGADWTPVPGAEALGARAFTFSPEDEGTFTYRGRGTTIVPPLYPDPQLTETTPWSDPSAEVKVDRSAPDAPSVTADRAPDFAGGGGWYRDTVTATFTDNGDPALQDGSAGSGVDPASIPDPVTKATSGASTISGTVSDLVGNVSAPGSLDVQVDATDPAVGVDCPSAVLVNAPASATVTASDGESGLASDPSGTVSIDTSTVGPKTVTRTAVDNVGHSSQSSCTTQVRYLYGGLQQPVNVDGSSIFKLGSSVPLKFRLTDYDGRPLSAAVAKITVAKITNAVEGTYVEAEAKGNSSTGNVFSQDGSGQYHYNLDSKTLSTGTWSLKVTLDDGTSYSTRISLR